MTNLQKINLGTAPSGQDGDTARSGNTKMNANVDVLSAQATLTSVPTITAPQTLTVDHLGKRVSISLADNGPVSPPPASTCPADSVILLRNVGTKVVALPPATGSGDDVALALLAPGEGALMDTDGVHAWNVLLRGRTLADDETVVGNLSVGKKLSVGGDATVTGGLSIGDAESAVTIGADGTASFPVRPQVGGKVIWDLGNLPSPMTLDTAQVVAAAKIFKSVLAISPNGETDAGDSYVSLTHTGAAFALAAAINGGALASLLSVDAAAMTKQLPYLFGRPAVTVHAYWTGAANNSAPITSAAYNCVATNQGTSGVVRVNFNSNFIGAQMIPLVSGVAASNGTSWCVPQIIAQAGNGAYVDIACNPTGGGGGGIVIGPGLSLVMLKVA